MGFKDRVASMFGRSSPAPPSGGERSVRAQVAGGSRATEPEYTENVGYFSSLPRKARVGLGLTESKLRNYSVAELLNLLSEVHPDVSYAVWNFIRLGCGGYSVMVTKTSGEYYERGQKAIDKFLLGLDFPNEPGFSQTLSLNRVASQMFRTVVIRGALAGELVLDKDRTTPMYLACVDPDTIDFKQDLDGRLVPWQKKKKLDIPNFYYEGLDTLPGDPYGTSPIVAAIQAVFFQLQILSDLKSVVHNQGYPKYDIKIIEEVLLKRMPITIRNNEEKKQQWLNDRLTEIMRMYSKLEPDAAFVHFDSVEANIVGGQKALVDPEKLMNVVNEQLNMALKTLSTVMGRRGNGNTETFAKVEIKLYLKGLEAMQWLVESVLSRMLTQVLHFNGLQGLVKFKFDDAEIRTELEAQQFKAIMIQNAEELVALGWMGNAEACRMVTGHEPVGPAVKLVPQKGEQKKPETDERGANNPQNSDSGGNTQ